MKSSDTSNNIEAHAQIYHKTASMVLANPEDKFNDSFCVNPNVEKSVKGDIILIRPKVSPLAFCSKHLDYGLHKVSVLKPG